MNVLAWQSYGTVKVLAADTPMHYFKIYEELKMAMQGWGVDAELEKLHEEMGKAKDEKACRRLFLNFVRPHMRSHESFESFDFSPLYNA